MDNCCDYLNFFEALKMLDVNVSIKMKIGEKDFYIMYQISVSNLSLIHISKNAHWHAPDRAEANASEKSCV